MGTTIQRGFTIIETMLFLAISGVLVVAVLVGSGVAINQQRYRDSVNSFASFLQDQYANVTAVHNDRMANWDCTNNGGLSQVAVGGSPRGASACAVVGQVIRSTDGTTVTSDTVVAHNLTAALGTSAVNDVQVFKAMSLQTLGSIDPTQLVSQRLDWGAKLVRPKSGSTPAAFSVLIMRSPLSGSIRTFIDATSGTTTLANLVNPSYLSQGITMCVDAQGLLNTEAGVSAVQIVPNSASAAGVRVGGAGLC